MDNIGARLKTIRTHQGLSQRQLARKAGVSNATVSLIEHGRTDPSMGLLRRILEAMGISFAEFFSSDSRPSDKYFYSSAELSAISSGPISYRQVGSDLRETPPGARRFSRSAPCSPNDAAWTTASQRFVADG